MLTVRAVHPYRPLPDEFEAALHAQCGDDLQGAKLAEARANTQDHFDGLFLVELESDVSIGPEFDWGEVTQETSGQPRANWQVAYDERPLDDFAKHWIFFFHFLNVETPLLTPLGPVRLPQPTPMPGPLASIRYEVP